jgi:hypothetical protein
LTEFGQAFGNLGHFIMNVAAEMPGLAEVLLHVLAGFTGFLAKISNVGPVLTFAMALEETYRWGGLVAGLGGRLVSWVGGLVTSLGGAIYNIDAFNMGLQDTGIAVTAAGEEITGVGAFLSGPWGWVIAGAAVGLGVLIDKFVTAQDAAQKFTSQLEAAIGKLNVTQGLFTLTQDLNTLDTGINNASSSMKTLAANNDELSVTGVNVRYGLETQSAAYSAADQQATAYSAAQQKLIGQFLDAQQAAEYVAKTYSVSLTSAYSMMDNAGLNLNTMFTKQGQLTAVAKQQIANLALGYQDMTGPSGALGNSINAVNAQLGLQGTKLSSVNSAWDQFLSNASGGTDAFASLESDLETMGNVTTSLNEQVSAFNLEKGGIVLTTQQIAKALTSFSGQSAEVWQSYDSALTQAGTVTDWWRTAAASGITTGTQLNQAIATTAKQLLPYAANSKAASAELGVLVQEAGGPAITSYQQLKSWIDQNALSQGQYNNLLDNTTVAMSNVTQAAQQFSQTLQSQVIQAVANGSINLSTVTADTQRFTAALQANGPQSTAVHSDMMALAEQFQKAGFSAQTAGAIIYQLGIQQGETKSQAQQLTQEMEQLIGTLNSVPKNVNSNVTITESVIHSSGSGTGSGGIYPTPSGSLPGFASGGRIPGFGGGDVVPAYLEPGEAVVPKHLVPGVAPYLGSHGVPGFAEGGYVGGSAAPGESGVVEVNVYLDGKQIQKSVQKQVYKTNRRNGTAVTGKMSPR